MPGIAPASGYLMMRETHTDKMKLLRMTSKQAIIIFDKCYEIISRKAALYSVLKISDCTAKLKKKFFLRLIKLGEISEVLITKE